VPTRSLYEVSFCGPATLFEGEDRKPDFWARFLQATARSSAHISWSKCAPAFTLFALLWSLPYPLFAQNPVPLWAELVQRLDASKVKVGDPILARLALAWRPCGDAKGSFQNREDFRNRRHL
jgi:hypothetical protein